MTHPASYRISRNAFLLIATAIPVGWEECVLIVQSDRADDTWCTPLIVRTERVGEIVYKLETERTRGRIGMLYRYLIVPKRGGLQNYAQCLIAGRMGIVEKSSLCAARGHVEITSTTKGSFHFNCRLKLHLIQKFILEGYKEVNYQIKAKLYYR
ncbi:hypothetical protein AVEN_178805-1 [Araneus ventricosus]|uniref:Uncharacterized protein n=1 Tax=Araneus ventricosus TaxID=182803 RepID=A0A4Y2BF31_ARAVE|nr:hypothetical protein AVEN_178805-1 [Araneus ventricosus]